ncbi:MAG: hypothetical protein DI536_24940 [Archangium gephyra]|uniref:PilZ domain-containing protein n=1 Tax=Archangium gephyra TaxID=48 RepID=A0A2W5UHL1_9BACT|nr:MAG: hypothetical protein DI536_24940 [Archangium gephyra]
MGAAVTALKVRYPHRRALLAAARAEGPVLSLFVPGHTELAPGTALAIEVSLDDSSLRFSLNGTVRAQFQRIARQEPGLAVVFTGEAKRPVAEMVAICAGRSVEDGTALDSRLQVDVSCLVDVSGQSVRAVMRDVSNSGAFIGTPSAPSLRPESELTVRFDPLFGRWGGNPLAARVVWVGHKHGMSGFGVRFLESAAIVRERLKKHLVR